MPSPLQPSRSELRALVRPKVNLTLRVLGRRSDGYHELESLVVFPDLAGDVVTLLPDREPHVVTVDGPFATAIAGVNIAETALRLLAGLKPALRLGAVRIEKRLPVAAGLGGGSGNAAAVLRLVRDLNAGRSTSIDWPGVARDLGADVPVCLAQQPSVMRGIGEELQPIARSGPPVPIVLAMADGAVPADKTAQVFRQLAAPPLGAMTVMPTAPPLLDSPSAVLAAVRSAGNDLTTPACALFPAIADTLAVMRRQAGCLHAQMSGAGPTCYGLFESSQAAAAAAAHLRQYSGWWIATGTI